jgi:hypothetical protein
MTNTLLFLSFALVLVRAALPKPFHSVKFLVPKLGKLCIGDYYTEHQHITVNVKEGLFKDRNLRERVKKSPKFTMMAMSDSGRTYFASAKGVERNGFTTEASEIVYFCAYNNEPSDLIVTMDLASDVMAKQTTNLVTKDQSDQIMNQINEIDLR